MEREFEQKVALNTGSRDESCNGATRSRNFAFRAPQENFTINDFDLGKLYGVGSYSKVDKENPLSHFLCFPHIRCLFTSECGKHQICYSEMVLS